jgi:hypothetical protein
MCAKSRARRCHLLAAPLFLSLHIFCECGVADYIQRGLSGTVYSLRHCHAPRFFGLLFLAVSAPCESKRRFALPNALFWLANSKNKSAETLCLLR